jgi:hypothetical protein
MKAAAFLLLAALAGATSIPGTARADDEKAATVNVNSIRNPEMRSYRSIWAGFKAFDEHRALAPVAPLRFRLIRPDGNPVGAEDGLVLRLASDEGSVPVPIGADGMLEIARSQAAYDADATFILNRKSGLFGARPDIRTPGLPANVRRLGDLRLECRVSVAIVKEQIPFLARGAINTLMLGSDWCGKKDMHVAYPAERALGGATIRHGGRSAELELHGQAYMAPIGNPGWPDDALVELRYEAPAAATQAPAP